MRTTADPRQLFRSIDVTDIGQEAYTFNVAEENLGRPQMVNEGEEFDRSEITYKNVEVEFEEYEDDEHIRQLALDTLRNEAMSKVAGDLIDTDHEYDTLFIDRERGEAYLVDTSKMGYEVIREKDEGGDAVRGNFATIYPKAALRIR